MNKETSTGLRCLKVLEGTDSCLVEAYSKDFPLWTLFEQLFISLSLSLRTSLANLSSPTIVFLCLEHLPQEIDDFIPEKFRTCDIIIMDYFSNPDSKPAHQSFSSIKKLSSSLFSVNSSISNEDSLLKDIEYVSKEIKKKEIILVIDSLNLLCFRLSSSFVDHENLSVSPLLHGLRSFSLFFNQLRTHENLTLSKSLCLAHRERFSRSLPSNHFISSLSIFFTSLISISIFISPSTLLSVPNTYSIQVIQKRKSTKVSKFTETVLFHKNIFLKINDESFESSSPSPLTSLSLSSSNLVEINPQTKSTNSGMMTMNLSLTEEQKKAKEATSLPYTHHLNQSQGTSNSTPGTSFIYLEDVDSDEDPDDDLDI